MGTDLSRRAADNAQLARVQRFRLVQSLTVLGLYVVLSAVQHLEVLVGLIDEQASWRLVAWSLSGGIIAPLLIASGLNLRCKADPSLTLLQSLWALAAITWSYAITGPARGAVMLITVLVLLFGVFELTPKQSRRLTATAFAMLAAAMTYKALTDPTAYDPRVEVTHFAFAAIIFAAVALLAERLGRLRARLVEQRRELAAALERIQALATRDELTGLLNRRAALDVLRAELRRRDRDKATMCVALIDLDHFKRINDNHGHAAGDRVLRAFADVATAEVRAPDVLSRWGGEEFLLMMPGTDEAEGAACLERMRHRLHGQAFDDVAPGLRITFSAGVAGCRSEQEIEAAIERADRAMYAAKHGGRDRVVRDGATGAAPQQAETAA